MTNDRGAAALAERLFSTSGLGRCLDAMDGQHRCRVHNAQWAAFSGPFCSARLAAILGEYGVFWPDGLGGHDLTEPAEHGGDRRFSSFKSENVGLKRAEAMSDAEVCERALREALDDHYPQASTYPDDTSWLTCSCGWDQDSSKLDWPNHILAALPTP